MDNQTGFIQSVKGKVIIASVLACFALLLAWGVSRLAFKQMLNAVGNISAPNDKLRMVNELTNKITRLDQLQKSQLLNNPDGYYSSFKESKKLNLTIDTLKLFYADDQDQIWRLNSLKKLLADRDRLFVSYLKVREGLINNQSFTAQVQTLNRLVNKSARQNDSTVTTTEKKTSTTTVYPTAVTESPRGFFSKLFGKKKTVQKDTPYQIVNEELHVKHDTLATAMQDSLIRGLGETMRNMEKTQLRKSVLFVHREAILTNANDRLIRRILTILKQVETEAVEKVDLNNSAAKNVVNTSITRISFIMIAFFMLTVILLYLILTDISRSNTYRKELELARDEAEYHSQAKQRFLSNMSHEIRTPLQSIIGYAELVKQQEHPDKKNLDAIYHSSAHLMQIVNEVLDYNRIISGKFTFTNQIFNMAALLDEVVTVMRFQAEKKAISLIVDYEILVDEYLEGDPFRLKQILYNLLGNGIKFTDKGEVKLSVARIEQAKGLQFTFTVADTGTGLSEQNVKRIFNEFEQAGGNLNNLKGTGLGLPISKALIEGQGGKINVKSELGKGSSFVFYIDFIKAAKPAEESTALNVHGTEADNTKVWIIDDDTFILDLCSTLFEKNNIPHRCFNYPSEILNADWDSNVKFILMDIRMPEMSGIDLCKLLKKKIPSDVMIYALTAQVMPDERELILTQCFDGLLMKPFKEHDLLALVGKIPVPNTENTADVEMDLRNVEKMTFGDKDRLNEILQRFINDGNDDIDELEAAIYKDGHERVSLLTHRIAGRTAQIGAGALAADFRLAEMDLATAQYLDSPQINIILTLIEKLRRLIRQIETDYFADKIL